ncbi:MAG: hypothetical protein JNM40_12045 [Myxococcales bacterium]|jgi:hypothetical protein|nr:hypothetical protein [Myxococcales bacterium]
MRFNLSVLVRRYLVSFAIAVAIVSSGAFLSSARAEVQKAAKPKLFRVITADENGKIAQSDLLEGGALTINGSDPSTLYKVTGQVLASGAIRLAIEETTESQLGCAYESLTLVPGADPAMSTLTGLAFSIDQGEHLTAERSDDKVNSLGRPVDPTTDRVCISCGGRSYCCTPAAGWCCTVTACGWRATECR